MKISGNGLNAGIAVARVILTMIAARIAARALILKTICLARLVTVSAAGIEIRKPDEHYF